MSRASASRSPICACTPSARWACSLKFENLSEGTIEAAKLFWYDSVGCALGGSQTEDAPILLEHHKQMHGAGDQNASPCTCFVTGYKTNPVDAAFLNNHMVRAMDYNDIYWKADPSHPSDIIAAPLALTFGAAAMASAIMMMPYKKKFGR